MPTVSVVIPAYNARTHIQKAVESVLRQTFTNFEVLIINNKLL
jgi:glycosyltransferase involved in cell wall biosynthesis